MRRPAVFFDRDNTLIVSDGYLGDPSKVVLVNAAAAAVARARLLGYATIVFSNQSGVARGMFGEDAVHAVNARLDELLAEQNHSAVIDRHEFCPFHPQGTVDQYAKESELRKPAPGMIHRAAEALALDLSRSWVIGDAPRDIEAGRAAGCRTILFQDPSLPASPAATSATHVLPDHYVQSLKDAMDIIERETANAAEPPPPSPDAAEPPTSNEPPPPRANTPAFSNPPSSASLEKLESLAQQILEAVREQPQRAAAAGDHTEHFSLTKMLAGIMQVLSLALLALAYFGHSDAEQERMTLAIFLQLFTIALLIMGRQR
jgi:D-glycero-D-manno-heptose 1,7-bisphosphate phosphatase